MFTCSLPYTSARISSSTSAACSLATASASRIAALVSPGVGLDFPEFGADEDLVVEIPVGLSVFSIAFNAVALAPSSADGASFFAGVVESIVRILAFGTGASPVMERTLAFAEAGGATAGVGGATVVLLEDASFPDGRLAMTGVCRG